MAQSPAHRFGQIIGEVLEAGVLPLLETFARDYGLYLDKKGDRPCRRGKKCSGRLLGRGAVLGGWWRRLQLTRRNGGASSARATAIGG